MNEITNASFTFLGFAVLSLGCAAVVLSLGFAAALVLGCAVLSLGCAAALVLGCAVLSLCCCCSESGLLLF